MRAPEPKEIRYISLCGMLGYGYDTGNFEKKISDCNIDFIGVDAGSTDPGPYYLGSGNNFVKDRQVIRDIEPALTAAFQNKIPLIIGSAGGAGSKQHVEKTLSLLRSIAEKNLLHFKTAVIYSDIDRSVIRNALNRGDIATCGNSGELRPEMIAESKNIVGQMGTGPIINALQNGADLIVAGRACDAAIFASYPMMKGFDPGLCMHAAKIAECGALCAIPAGANDSLHVTLKKNCFIVEPLSTKRKCTPASVAAHSMYEQPNPECFYEPEGKIDMRNCSFIQKQKGAIQVSGTLLEEAENETIKIEGVRLAGYRALTFAGTADPSVIKHIDILQEKVKEAVNTAARQNISHDKYSLRFLRYGLDAVRFGKTTSQNSPPHELGLLIEAVAHTQEDADHIISLARSTALHQDFRGRKTTAGNLAFPFSPSDIKGGPVYEFSIYHLMKIPKNDSTELFKTVYQEF